jgi:hypothetical protein
VLLAWAVLALAGHPALLGALAALIAQPEHAAEAPTTLLGIVAHGL